MRIGLRVARLAARITTLAVPAAGWALGRHAWHLALTWPRVWEVDDAIALGASALGTAVAAYLTLTALAIALSGAASRGRRALPRGLAPVAWRRLVALAWGVGLTSGLAAPALAMETGAPTAGWGAGAHAAAEQPVDVAPPAPDAGWGSAAGTMTVTPQPEAPQPPVDPVPRPPTQEPPADSYVVQQGDSLWRIAQHMIGNDATDPEITAAWHTIYDANREAIGADPGLIHPGLALVIPAEVAR